MQTGSRRRGAGIGDRGGVIWQFAKTVRGRPMIVVGEVLKKVCCVVTVKPGRF
ncbi:MAG: hypothetical protein ACREIA_26955 [Opitutaceae bacterium]